MVSAQPTAPAAPVADPAPAPPVAGAPPEEAPPATVTAPAPAVAPPVKAEEVAPAAPPKEQVAEKPAAQPIRRARYDVAVLQALDKVTAETLRFEAAVGRPVRWKGLVFTVRACERSAPDEAIDDAIVYLTIDSQPRPQPGRPTPAPKQAFKGWMFASSPGLNPVEHASYDAWVISCRASAPGPSVASAAPAAPAVKAPPAAEPAAPKMLDLPPAKVAAPAVSTDASPAPAPKASGSESPNP
ncbi:DUF2155 domain-containing protein [Phenylobacterium kunshanense]|uniref:DUF2155 domain-containing protein n=1 Tax=Phenylobacterium kunshanense TaxID=1445034 RepID=A0A328BTC6_9CAUL|nr:DUF2155 domain-containing protein [Phenylobacterium kunshanense]RAK69276.1 DUF2155 domain-containing protein [Phenylobacterium kunshanense]